MFAIAILRKIYGHGKTELIRSRYYDHDAVRSAVDALRESYEYDWAHCAEIWVMEAAVVKKALTRMARLRDFRSTILDYNC